MFSTKESTQLNAKAQQINDSFKLATAPFAQPKLVNSETGVELSEEEATEMFAKSRIFSTFTSLENLQQMNAALQGSNNQNLEAIEAMEEGTPSEENEDGRMLDMYGAETPNPAMSRHFSYSESEYVEMVGEKVVHSKMSSQNMSQSSKSVYSLEEFQNYVAAMSSEESEV